MRHKGAIDLAVAEETGIPQKVVSLVTAAWIDAVRDALVKDGLVHIHMLGTLSVHVSDGGILYRRTARGKISPTDVPFRILIRFRKTPTLRTQLQRYYVAPPGENNANRGKRRDGEVRGRRKRRR